MDFTNGVPLSTLNKSIDVVGQALHAAIDQAIEFGPSRPLIRNPQTLPAACTEHTRIIHDYNPHAASFHNKGKLRLGFKLGRKRSTSSLQSVDGLALAEEADGSWNAFGRKCYATATYALDEVIAVSVA